LKFEKLVTLSIKLILKYPVEYPIVADNDNARWDNLMWGHRENIAHCVFSAAAADNSGRIESNV